MPVYSDHHVTRIWKDKDAGSSTGNLIASLFWGDELRSAEVEGDFTRVVLAGGEAGWVKGALRTRPQPTLGLAFIDVGQGDACLITTPDGRRVLVDGGENQMAARYIAKRYWSETASGTDVVFDAIVVTHGDADHFRGLVELVDAAKETRDFKRIRVLAKRVFHNGIVKRRAAAADGTKRPDAALLGNTFRSTDGTLLLSDLVDDPRSVPREEANQHFQKWADALSELAARFPSMIVKKLDSSCRDAFDFCNSVTFEVLGPRLTTASPAGEGLVMLSDDPGSAPSSSATINGHSVVLRLVFGRVKVLLTGDLTHAGAENLVALARDGKIDLQSEILKVPHHGSDDVSADFLRQVAPVLSVISAGDEDARRDYLHPRANVVGLLGKVGRCDEPLIFVTNLSAFDKWKGPAFKAVEDKDGKSVPDIAAGTFYARERTTYGIVHVRTDGESVFVARHSARKDRREAYVFAVNPDGKATRQNLDVI
ncbi:MAG: MBL fold metallo-hydrolase [Deltaproteobacteria bacterium]|nr:MBL fold metallo-hydrolase [Deltaproteobacteria bacterium]